MTTQNKRLSIILLIVVTILLIPFFVMQFTNEVKWSFPDFIIAGILLFGTGLLIDFILRKTKKINYRIVAIILIVLLLLLIWAELAVGIFGTPFAGS
jgi:ABC-type cobalt transport system substrate-binding protein